MMTSPTLSIMFCAEHLLFFGEKNAALLLAHVLAALYRFNSMVGVLFQRRASGVGGGGVGIAEMT